MSSSPGSTLREAIVADPARRPAAPATSNSDVEDRRERLLANPARRALIKAFAALLVADLTRYPVR